MECERLKKLIKNWYTQVQDESMAPARMVDFMRNHITDCVDCLGDPIVELEVKRITEIVLPPSKIPKAVRREEAQEEKADSEADDVKTEDTEEETSEEETENDDDLDPDDEDDEI